MKDALAKAPGIQIVEVFDIKEDTVRVRRDHRHRHRAATPISPPGSRSGGWPVFTRNATAGIDPAKTKLIAFDTIEPALDLLREGKVRCSSARSTSAGAANR